MSQVTVKELDALIAEIVKQEDLIEQKEEDVSNERKKLMEMNGKAVAYLKELEREDYDSAFGKAQINQKWSVTNPQTDEDKVAFFTHLREKGGEKLLYKYMGVHNGSLNSYFKQEWEEAKKRGEGLEFSIPGILPAKLHETFKIARPRKKKGAASDVG